MSPARSTGATADVAAPVLELIPTGGGVERDAESAWVHHLDGWRQVRLHACGALFAVPSLYETVVTELLDCDSHRMVVDELAAALHQAGVGPARLRGLDLGAGNGMAAEQLHRVGVQDIVGIDRLPEAAHAAGRDRPGLYRSYRVGDITTMTAADVAGADGNPAPNLLVCVAALGFGDIPPEAFSAAVGLLAPGSWIAFNIKDAFLEASDPTGFAHLLAEYVMYQQLTIVRERSYVHRHSHAGEPLHYTSIIARTD